MTLPLRIVRLITWLPVGGIERRLVAILPRLDGRIFAPEVICLRERGSLADELESNGIPVCVERLRSRLSPTGIWRLSRRLRGAAIVHSHMYRANVPGTIAARLAKVPVILGQVHNVDTWERPSQRRWDRRTERWRTATLTVSASVQQNVAQTLGISPERCPVLHNGVDLAPFADPEPRDSVRQALGLNQEATLLVCPARLHPQKNHAGLLRAVASLPADLPPWHLVLLGDGSARPDIERTIQSLDLTHRVTMLGSRDDVPRILLSADVAVLASEKEGFSNAVIECLAAGLPIVATDVGGNAEAIREGETGFLVTRGDMGAFAERLASLIRDAALRAEMGKAARLSAGAFSLEEMIRKTELIYLECLQRAQPWLFEANPGLTNALQARQT